MSVEMEAALYVVAVAVLLLGLFAVMAGWFWLCQKIANAGKTNTATAVLLLPFVLLGSISLYYSAKKHITAERAKTTVGGR